MSTAQKPIISGYNATSTAEEIAKGIDLSGKLAIVTGGYSGIGLRRLHFASGSGKGMPLALKAASASRCQDSAS